MLLLSWTFDLSSRGLHTLHGAPIASIGALAEYEASGLVSEYFLQEVFKRRFVAFSGTLLVLLNERIAGLDGAKGAVARHDDGIVVNNVDVGVPAVHASRVEVGVAMREHVVGLAVTNRNDVAERFFDALLGNSYFHFAYLRNISAEFS